MKFVAYAAAIAMLTATAAYADSGNMSGAADSQSAPAMQNAPSKAMPSKNLAGQNEAAPIGQQQSAQMPNGCNASDSTCGDARGNPAVKSPTQKKVLPASPQ